MRSYSHQDSNQHYFNQASQSPQEYFPLRFKVASYILQLQSAKGIFSAEEFDKGTTTLLKHLKKVITFWSSNTGTTHILDLWCGYGIVSCWLIAHANHQERLWNISIDAVDSSPLAVDLTQHNIKKTLWSHIDKSSFHVIESDGFKDKYFSHQSYNYIISNPPFSVGKKTVQSFISESYRYLVPWGQLWLVAPTNKGAKSYISYTEEIFGKNQVEVMALESGYRVWRATKATEASA